MKSRIAIILGIGLIGLIVACSAKEEKSSDTKAKTTEPTASTANVSPHRSLGTPAIGAIEDLPVSTDFEDEAEASITKDNMQQELERIAAEIAKSEE